MRFNNVCLESIAVALPTEVWTSAQIEQRLEPLYERLRLPFGRLELMTGIRERRMWPDGTKPSDASAAAGRAVLGESCITREQIGLFIHGAVSRDMLEPASASFAHRKIGLPASMHIFDVSNACLGFLNSIVVAAAQIEAGQIQAALLVSGENGRPLVDETIRTLLAGSFDRNAIKPFFANLTIGCGAVGAVVCHRDLVKGRAHRILGGVCLSATEHSELCQGDTGDSGSLAMQTDSERMLDAGVTLAKKAWEEFVRSTGWTGESVNNVICHQVGSAHRRRLFETLSLDVSKDYSTFETLGNMGSVSLPATLSAAVQAGRVREGSQVALMGNWQRPQLPHVGPRMVDGSSGVVPGWLAKIYPFNPSSFRTPSGARMSFLDVGPRTDAAVLMLHGNPTWSFYYRNLVTALAGRIRCIAPDHVGMGLSDKPFGYDYTLASRIADIEGLIDELGVRKIHLVVHDWGGAIGFGVATRRPERVGRIVVQNTAAFTSDRIPLRIRLCRVPGLGEFVVRGLNGFAEPATWMAMASRRMRWQERRAYLYPYDSWAHRIGVHRFVRDIPLERTHPSRSELETIERNLGLLSANEKLFVWGSRDFCFDESFLSRWRDIYPDARVERLDGVGHYVLEDADPGICSRIADFLTRT